MKILRAPQRGFVTIAAALILIAGVIFWLQQTYGIVGNTSRSNVAQNESVQAFFLAESGLERKFSQLKAAPDPTALAACETNPLAETVSLGSGGTFTVSATATGCDGSALNCTSCTITSTSTVGSATRTVVSVAGLSAPNGGAIGCGGGGGDDPATTDVVETNYVSTTNCPTPPVISGDKHPKIDQSITVKSTDIGPVLVMTNLAYLRHPAGVGGSGAFANSCILGSSGTCTLGWNDQSSSTSADPVVGARGATVSAAVSASDTDYTFSQGLTIDSMYAAVGAKLPSLTTGSAGIQGSFWDDLNGNTVANSASGTAYGYTNDGTACSYEASGDVNCPPSSAVTETASFGTAQASKNWCYRADTLVFGFSATSKSTGDAKLNTFAFGTASSSLTQVVPNGTAQFPQAAGTSKVVSTLRFIYNKDYMSTSGGAGATSYTAAINGSIGAKVTGTIGAIFKGSAGSKAPGKGGAITTSSTIDFANLCNNCLLKDGDKVVYEYPSGTFVVTYIATGGVGTNTITVSPEVYAPNNTDFEVFSNHFNVLTISQGYLCNGDSVVGTTLSLGPQCTNNVPALYTLAAQARGTSTAFDINSQTLYATSAPTGTLAAGTAFNGIGVTLGSTTPDIYGNYTVSPAALVAPTTLTQGPSTTTITLPNPGNLPPAGTHVAVYSGSGKFGTRDVGGKDYAVYATVAPNPTGKQFTVTLEPGATMSPITNAIICGGICAYFNHDATVGAAGKLGMTPFVITQDHTQQWAAGMTCMRGVNPLLIEGLTGNAAGVTATNWHEVVR